MAKAYDILAKYYDYLQRDIDYSTWSNLVKNYSSKDSKILEIGCGTGKLISLLDVDSKQYHGYDFSKSMIDIAKCNNHGYDFFVADACEYKTNDKFDLIICFMDTINYIIDLSKLDALFKNHSEMLSDSGYFIFDIHQEENIYNFDGYLESGFIDGDEYRWYSHIIDEKHHIVAHDFEFIIDKEKHTETHIQNISSRDVYYTLLKKYYNIVETFDDDYRHYFILSKRRF